MLVFSGGTRVSDSGYVVGGLWGSIMRTTKKIGKAVIKPKVFALVAPIVASAIPGGGVAYAAATKINDIVSKARENHPEAMQAIAAIRAEAGRDPKALEVAKTMKAMSDKLDEKMAQIAAAQKVSAQAQIQTSVPAASFAEPSTALAPAPSTQTGKSGGSGMMIALAALAGVGLLLATRK